MENNLTPELRFPEFQDEWNKSIIKEIANKITDGTHDTPKATETGIPFLTAIHVRDGFIDFENCYYLPEDVHQKIYARCSPEKDDLLMVNIGAGVATSAKVDADFEFSLKNVALIKPNKSKIDPDFFTQIQRRNSARLRHQISAGGAQPFLSLKEIGNLKLIIPNKKTEQTKIANFLTVIDKRINLLQKKKAELVQYKKGVMQKLFSQTIRFKDENGNDFPDWEEKKLGEIGVFQTSSVDKISNDDEEQVYLVNYMNVYRHENISNSTRGNLQVVTAKENQIKSSNLKKGDILFTPSSETPSDIGHSVVIFEDLENTLFSYHLMRFRPSVKLDLLYSHYFCNIPSVLKQLSSFATGSTRFTISVGNFSKIKVQLPSIDEQIKIAKYLSKIDKSIERLGNQIDNSTKFKQGLLQKMFV
ncbi:restriction endonuclease subunit S [Geofilum rubicundum]|uniref:Type I restriction-modification system, specificity subunit S n=1 Tax=Geofilum rubicundum JCM 15548 TaxID=1236989 RepID=A0A0E9LR74_9BACT|nr:restriction endonuclease subunit S [Geofilum rubicundum]GAO27749.1 type I restriction-modification system, specificity subunit S [Geofilum rubicundum JCM 15548]